MNGLTANTQYTFSIVATSSVGNSSSNIYSSFSLDNETSASAYSLRKLRDTYNGSAIRVRRSSDNSEADIAFTSTNELDTNQLLQFVGAGNNGFVKIWYDQSGNGRHAVQTTVANQPRIVNSGVIETYNGKSSINIITGTSLVATDPLAGVDGSDVTISSVGTAGFSRGRDGFGGWSISKTRVIFISGGTGLYTYPVPVSGNNNLYAVVINQGTSSSDISQIWAGVQGNTLTAPKITLRSSTLGLQLGFDNNTSSPGFLQEFIVFPNVVTQNNLITLQRNQGSFYGINVN
jgi:hypothetical protein